MSTAPVLVIAQQPDPDSWDAFIARVGSALSDLERQGDAASWQKAKIIIDADLEADRRPEMDGLALHQISKRLNSDLRRYWRDTKKTEVRASFMTSARKLYATWPDISFETDIMSKIMPYEHYRQMAVCSLPRDQKNELRTWAEETHPTQSELRQVIRDRVDAIKGIFRPDFDLKVSNHWVFQVDKRGDGFDGGVNYDLYANLIHSFSDPDDVIIDPFAGGGILADTLTRYRHFREVTQAQHSGPRMPLMSDIAPTREDIFEADARVRLPFDDKVAALAIIDPPYLTASDGKYASLGQTIQEWLEGLRAALRATARCLAADGIVAVMTDDVVRKRTHEPVGLRVLGLLLEEGWEPITTIYNFNRNFIGMSQSEMARAKAARLHVNAVKIIQVARRP